MEGPKVRRKSGRSDGRVIVCALVFFIFAWLGAVAYIAYFSSTSSPIRKEIPQILTKPHLKATEQEKKKNEEVSSALKYWHIPDKEALAGLFRQPDTLDRYVLFISDCGGFNNIRMAFEYFYMTAWLTKRTLVLPPPHGWYLIDFGPMAVMKREPSDEATTDYSEFFDLEHMRAAVPVISTEEFRRREPQLLTEEILKADLKTRAGQKLWETYVRDNTKHPALAWSPLNFIVYFPSIKAVEASWRDRGGVPKTVVHHRKPVEFSPEIYASKIISFPSCKKGDWNDDHMRFLGQMAKYGAFADDTMNKAFKRTLRDHVHFPSIVFDLAARVVNAIGLFSFTALHVRRNELQYKEVFMTAAETLENIRPLLKPGEPIYIATDETDPSFFAAIEKEHPIFKWDDFFTAKGKNALVGVKIPRKLIGCIEQVICAGARAFMGTLESTYTAYIFRLRGYINAPNTEVYFHTLKYVNDIDKDRAMTWSKKPERGMVYQTEHRDMWTDLQF